MDVVHADKEMERLEFDATYSGGRDFRLVRSYRKVLNWIRSVSHENELRKYPSRHFEKIKGSSTLRSLRLWDKWRLILEIERRAEGNRIRIKGIWDHD